MCCLPDSKGGFLLPFMVFVWCKISDQAYPGSKSANCELLYTCLFSLSQINIPFAYDLLFLLFSCTSVIPLFVKCYIPLCMIGWILEIPLV